MSTQPEAAPGVPEWDTADRMRKALRTSGIGVEEMATYLDVTRRSIGNWINGHVQPSKQTLRLWALRCGVDFNWLCHGDSTPCVPGPGKSVPAGQRHGDYEPKFPIAPITILPVRKTPSFRQIIAKPVAA